METPNNHAGSSSANDAATQQPISTTPATPHRRIPFVHRLSSFRRNHHSRTTSANSQLSTSVSDTTAATITPKNKDDLLSSDLILKVAIVRGRSLAREDEVKIPKTATNTSCVLFIP
jgi:hypothetical protein